MSVFLRGNIENIDVFCIAFILTVKFYLLLLANKYLPRLIANEHSIAAKENKLVFNVQLFQKVNQPKGSHLILKYNTELT